MALLVVLGALILVLALTSALVLTSIVEVNIAATASDEVLVSSAADAAALRAVIALRAMDWNAALRGEVTAFTDGPSGGMRLLPDGVQIALPAETADLQCGRSSCSDPDIATVAEERPWGPRNPRWRLFGHGPLATLVPGDTEPPPGYVMLWIADDPADNDDDPATDGELVDNPGKGLVMVAARAYGARGTRRTVELLIERTGPDLRILARHERHP